MLELSSISWFQWGGLICGTLYIFLAAKGKKWCWLFLFISSISISLEDFYHSQLYFDAVLQLFYALLAALNMWIWYNHKDEPANSSTLRISTLDIRRNLAYFFIVLSIAITTGYFLHWNLEMAYTFLDSIKSLLAVMATFLLIYKILDAWYYWLLVNVISIYLFMITGTYAIALLYLIYLIASCSIFIQWHRRYSAQSMSSRI